MLTPIIIIDNHLELEIIERQYPELKESQLILLSSNFSLQQLEKYNQRGYSNFDDLITQNEAIQLSKNLYELLWTWFIDEKGNDLA